MLIARHVKLNHNIMHIHIKMYLLLLIYLFVNTFVLKTYIFHITIYILSFYHIYIFLFQQMLYEIN